MSEHTEFPLLFAPPATTVFYCSCSRLQDFLLDISEGEISVRCAKCKKYPNVDTELLEAEDIRIRLHRKRTCGDEKGDGGCRSACDHDYWLYVEVL